MSSQHPETGIWYYFIDKCLPFGASISCADFQKFSNSLKHVVELKANQTLLILITNYLDDFLFIYITIQGCNTIVRIFLGICSEIGFPIVIDKTEWASVIMTFVGMLLNGITLMLSIPLEKRNEALQMVRKFKHKNKATIKDLQKLSGHLNFINRAMVLGRVFT